jgi:hypothetical protein
MCKNLSHYHNVKVSGTDKTSTDAVKAPYGENTVSAAGSFGLNSSLLTKGSIPEPCYET